MSSRTIKGFNEFVGVEAAKRAAVRKIILRNFELYGFEPTESPTIEAEEFVGKDANEDTISEIFRLKDRGGRKLALKYESTFQLKRLARNQKLPFKRYVMTQVFRDEPVKANRFREFSQCDADIVGSGLKDEAEILSLISGILKDLGIGSTIYVNNRRLLNEIMVDLGIEERNREQVVREIDKLDKLDKVKVADNLRKIGGERILEVIDGKDFSKYKFYGEIKELIKLCKVYGVSVKFSPTLARGLAYYNGTVFEVKTEVSGASICGGGAYMVGDVQAVGFAFGLDRLCVLSDVVGEGAEILVLSLGKDKVAIDLAEKLRGEGVCTMLLIDKGLSKGLEYADGKGIRKVVFVGKDEVKVGKFRVRDMITGNEELVSESEVLDLVGED